MGKSRKKRKNGFGKLIRYELICLAAVSLIVFGAVRWSEGRGSAARTGVNSAKAEQQTGQSGKDERQDGPSPEPTPEPKPSDEPREGTEPFHASGESYKSTEPFRASDGNGMSSDPLTETGTENTPAAMTPEPEKGDAAGPGDSKEPAPAVNRNPDMDLEFIDALSQPQAGEIIEAKGAVRTVYYQQTDSRWGSLIYGGEDTIAKYACGPTSMAVVVSSLTDIGIDPVQMAKWACDNGYWVSGSGSAHTIVNGTAKAFGLESEGVGNDAKTAEKVIANLKEGGMAVALMGKGHFTRGGHFIVLRGVTEDGKILVADCNSRDNTMQEWDMETLLTEAKYAADGGPFWIIKPSNTIE